VLIDKALPDDHRIHVLFLSVRPRLQSTGLGDLADSGETEAVPDRQGSVVVCGGRGEFLLAYSGWKSHTLEDQVEDRTSVS
jgi:hypothetical protein